MDKMQYAKINKYTYIFFTIILTYNLTNSYGLFGDLKSILTKIYVYLKD